HALPPCPALIYRPCRTVVPPSAARHSLSSRRRFPRHYLLFVVSIQLHRFGFNSLGVVPNPTLGVWYSRLAQEPVANRVAPNLGMASLVPQPRKAFSVALFINLAFERLPLSNESLSLPGALVMRIIDVLDHRLTGMQNVRIRHMMHDHQHLIGPGCKRFSRSP